MISSSSSSSSCSNSNNKGDQLAALLDAARPFLRGELGSSGDPDIPQLVSTLRSAGAGECWHKHGSFLDHLVDVYRILRLWGASDVVSRCGLYHSAYSNSYVNLAIFDASTSRGDVSRLIGPDAENLVYLFCVVPRQSLIHDDILFRYTSDDELRAHLRASDISIAAFRSGGGGGADPSEPWRAKLRSVVPADGVVVKHIKTGEDLRISRRTVAAFLLMTMADFSDQLFGFQDEQFCNHDGRLSFSGNNPGALWPGEGKPGLWMNSVSRMGAIYAMITREEEICSDVAEVDLVIPPVFDGCTGVLDRDEQREARDLYWEASTRTGGGGAKEEVELMLRRSGEKNPYVGEPKLVLAQVLMGEGRYEEAEREAAEGLRLMLAWGSSWDKRMSWEGWVAWARVLLLKAQEKSWPNTSWGILNLGLVRTTT